MMCTQVRNHIFYGITSDTAKLTGSGAGSAYFLKEARLLFLEMTTVKHYLVVPDLGASGP